MACQGVPMKVCMPNICQIHLICFSPLSPYAYYVSVSIATQTKPSVFSNISSPVLSGSTIELECTETTNTTYTKSYIWTKDTVTLDDTTTRSFTKLVTGPSTPFGTYTCECKITTSAENITGAITSDGYTVTVYRKFICLIECAIHLPVTFVNTFSNQA